MISVFTTIKNILFFFISHHRKQETDQQGPHIPVRTTVCPPPQATWSTFSGIPVTSWGTL